MPDEAQYLLEAEALPPRAVLRATKTGRVLVVDDDEDVLITLGAVLQQEGHQVTGVRDGQMALALLEQADFDVLVVDLRLDDDVDGLAVLHRALQHRPDIVGIVLTGFGTLESAIQALHAGALSYLLKPCNVNQLTAAVVRGLEKRAAAETIRELRLAAARAVEDRAGAQVRESQAREEQAQEAAARASERLAHLQALTEQLAHYMQPQALLEQVVHAAAQLLEFPIAAVFLLPAPEADFELAAAEGLADGRGRRLPRQRSLGAQAVVQRTTLAINDVRHIPDVVLPTLAGGKRVGSIAVAPICDDARPLGVLEVYSPAIHYWTKDEIDLLSSLAAAAGVALAAARTHDELQRATRVRDEVIASVTHDLKTPLTTISGLAQLLKRRVES